MAGEAAAHVQAVPSGTAKGRCGCLTAAYSLPVHQKEPSLPSVKFLLAFAISLLAVAILTALRTMARPEVKNIRPRLSESPADLWIKRWFVIFPMGVVANLLNPLNWIAASILAAFSAALRALL